MMSGLLKKKVLCSLLAASAFGIMYHPSAEAAMINGKEVDSKITDEVVFDAGSGKLVIGQGNLDIQTKSSIHTIMNKYNSYLKAHPGDTSGALRWALAPTSSANGDPNDVPLVGVVGGEGQIDSGLTGLFNNKFDGDVPLISSVGSIKDLLNNEFLMGIIEKMYPNMAGAADKANDLINKIESVNTAKENNKVIGSETEKSNVNIGIGSKDGASPVVIGIVGGDLSVNTGLNGNITVSGKHKPIIGQEKDVSSSINVAADETSITRYGDVNMVINNGNVLGGMSGSAAVTVGNIKISYENKVGEIPVVGKDVKLDADFTMQGKTTTTINGDVNVGIYGGSNVAGFTGGGTAAAIGGEAASIVNGDVNINIDSTVDLMDDASNNAKFDGITAGIAGGGTAVSTFGGTATTKVNNVNITINNGLSAGIIGGGIAASGDATGAAETVMGGQLGNDGGYVDINKKQLEELLGQTIPGDKLDIVIKDAVQGGTATSVTGDTNITLTGNTSAAGILGGGLAAASHTYTWKGDGTGSEEEHGKYNNNDSFGSSVAKAESGKTTITINVDSSKMNGEQKSEFLTALKALKDTKNLANVNTALKKLQGTGAVIGVVGGGAAIAQGSSRSNMDGTSGNWGENGQGAYATAANTGAEINLVNGYVAGTFGGGMAITDNNAKATSETTGDIKINIGNGTEAIGVFGNGLAYFTGSSDGGTKNLAGTAEVIADNSTINVGVDFNGIDGTDKTTKVDGIVAGGVAIDDSQADVSNAAVKTNGKATVNIFDGAEVNTINYDPLKAVAGKPVATDNGNHVKGGSPDMGSYIYGLEAVAGNVAIAGGGIAIGGGAESYVHESEINIAGGTVNGDILGGVAVYGYNGKDGQPAGGSVVDNATINLYGGTVNGDVYAGGAALKFDYAENGHDQAQSTVKTATVNLAGTEVNGIISGAGYYIDEVEYNANDKVTNVPEKNNLTILWIAP